MQRGVLVVLLGTWLNFYCIVWPGEEVAGSCAFTFRIENAQEFLLKVIYGKQVFDAAKMTLACPININSLINERGK